jgi:hypothetical protein
MRSADQKRKAMPGSSTHNRLLRRSLRHYPRRTARSRISEAQKRRLPESRFPSEETRVKISAGRRRFEAAKKEALAMGEIR